MQVCTMLNSLTEKARKGATGELPFSSSKRCHFTIYTMSQSSTGAVFLNTETWKQKQYYLNQMSTMYHLEAVTFFYERQKNDIYIINRGKLDCTFCRKQTDLLK